MSTTREGGGPPPSGGLFSTGERGIFRRTLPADVPKDQTFTRSLTLLQLTMIGVGAIIGAGIFSLAGEVARNTAGPAVVISFLIAGAASLCAAYAYAEFSSLVPRAGSSYTYGAAVLGEFVGWLIGWDLLLEYTAIVAVVAIGVSGYLNYVLEAIGLGLPQWAAASPFAEENPGVVDLGAVIVCLGVGFLLTRGTKSSARVETVLTIIKIIIVCVVVGVGVFYVDPGNLADFMPFGWPGVFAGASVVFFAVFGYDALSTAAEESEDSRRKMPKAMLLSLGICMVLYVAVALVMCGMVLYTELDPEAALAYAFQAHGLGWLGLVIAIGAVVGIVTVCFTFMMAGARLWYAMSRDGLMPRWFATMHRKNKVPHRPTWVIAVLAAILAGVAPIGIVAELVNIGVLAAFIVVSLAVLVLRYRRPDLPREFRMPLMPVLPIVGVGFSLFLIAQLPLDTFIRFFGWMAIGIVVYVLYGYRRTRRVMPGGSVDIAKITTDDTGTEPAGGPGADPRS
ncbi:amino acid permease [Naumannella huperziae]